jgi:hypothetical protein
LLGPFGDQADAQRVQSLSQRACRIVQQANKRPRPASSRRARPGESGELEFQLDELDVFFDGVMNEMLGTPLKVPRFKLDPKSAL